MRWSSSLGTGIKQAFLFLSVVSTQPKLSPYMMLYRGMHRLVLYTAVGCILHMQRDNPGIMLPLLAPEHANFSVFDMLAHLDSSQAGTHLCLTGQLLHECQLTPTSIIAHVPLAN